MLYTFVSSISHRSVCPINTVSFSSGFAVPKVDEEPSCLGGITFHDTIHVVISVTSQVRDGVGCESNVIVFIDLCNEGFESKFGGAFT